MKNENQNHNPNNADDLRHKAEKILSSMERSNFSENSMEDAQRLITELQVHQVELELQNDELRKMQIQLAEEREKYADLYNFAPAAYFTFDERDLIQDLNLTAAEMLGNERKYLVGHPLIPYLTPDSIQAFVEHRQLAFETKRPQTCELVIRRRDGRFICVQSHTVALSSTNSGHQSWRSVMTDITLRKQQEEKVRFQAHLLGRVSDAVIATDNEMRITQWNRAAEILFGWKESEALGKVLDTLCRTEFNNITRAEIQDYLKKFKFWNGEILQYHRNGTRVVINASISLLEDASGKPSGEVTISHNITERKEAEKKLRESEKRYRKLVENSPAVVYTFSNKRGGIYYSPVVEKVLGYPLLYLYEHPFLWNESIHPDDVPIVRNAIAKSKNNISFDIEYRVRDARGNWHWLHDLSIGCRTIGDEVFIEGMATDITERKQIERELQESHIQLEATLNALPDLMFEVDRNGRVHNFHQPHFGGMQFPHEAFIGRSAFESMPPRAAQAVRLALMEAEENGSSFGSTYSLDMHGETIWFEISVSAKGDPSAPDARFIILARDITERKKNEEELNLANQVLQSHVAEIEILHKQLREQAIRDPLTGLFNRRYLEETLDREIARALRENKPVGFIILDIDLFKNVNDKYGHKMGDLVLKSMGELLIQNLRTGDIPCRYGGEEFTILMPGATLSSTVDRATHLQKLINSQVTIFDEDRVSITVSMGIAAYPMHGHSGEDVLIRADRALYRAKETGRNRIIVYQSDTMPLRRRDA